MKRYGTFSGCGEYMNIVTLCGFGILAAVLCVIVRQIKPESAVFVSIAAGIGILAAVVTAAAPSVGAITELAENAGIDGEFTKVLLKALAVCYITTLSADCARDAGESAVAAKLELGGRISIAMLSLPVFIELANMVTGLIG
ncbi:MAG: hypothetical protein OSJ43_08150 [Oscillospiraceae bacterium]|nr:hypothetical protein [Oscillospiraceae bacterium]